MISKDEANATWIPASRMNFTPAPPNFSSGSTWPMTCHGKVNAEVKSGLVGCSSVLRTSLHALRDHQLVAGPGSPLRSDVFYSQVHHLRKTVKTLACPVRDDRVPAYCKWLSQRSP